MGIAAHIKTAAHMVEVSVDSNRKRDVISLCRDNMVLQMIPSQFSILTGEMPVSSDETSRHNSVNGGLISDRIDNESMMVSKYMIH